MSDAAISQIEDAWKAKLEAWPALAGQNVITDRSVDVAVDETEFPAIIIYTVAYSIDNAFEHHQVQHTATLEFEVVSGTPTVGTISRANHTTIAHIAACIASDRTLGGILQDTQEVDVAPAASNGRDVGAASLQVSIQFYTSRDDWFTIINQ